MRRAKTPLPVFQRRVLENSFVKAIYCRFYQTLAVEPWQVASIIFDTEMFGNHGLDTIVPKDRTEYQNMAWPELVAMEKHIADLLARFQGTLGFRTGLGLS